MQIRELLRAVTANLTWDLAQHIRAKLDPLILPQGSPMTPAALPHRVKGNHLVAGLSHTLGGAGSWPMPTTTAIPRSPFVPRTPRLPYNHVKNSTRVSTRAEVDQLGCTALRAMVDVEPCGFSDMGGDLLDNESPSPSCASPSKDDNSDDPDETGSKKKKTKRRVNAMKDAAPGRPRLSPPSGYLSSLGRTSASSPTALAGS